MTELVMKIATEENVPLVLEFMRQFYAIDQYPFEEEINEKAVTDFIKDTALGRLWLIGDGEEWAGYIVLTFGYSFEYDGRDAFIDEFFILPAYQNQGLGTQVLDFVEAVCPELGVHAVHLEVEHHNPALTLYERAGFKDNKRYLMTRRVGGRRQEVGGEE